MIDTTTIRRTPARSPASLQVPGGGREELRRRLLVGRRAGGRVDDRLDARQRLGQAFAGDDVDARGAGDRDDVVSPLLEHVDDMTADPAGRSCDCDLLLGLHHWAPFSLLS